MLIYIVSHYWDNGESYEDYDHYEEHKYYSSLMLASQSFWRKASEDYEGKYTLKSKELDTQGEELLEETPYIECSSVYNNWEEEIHSSEDYYENYNSDYDSALMESCQEEIEAEKSWLTHKGEQYEILQSIEEDRLLDALKESDAFWDNLGMLD